MSSAEQLAERYAPRPVGLRSASLALLTAALWGANPVAVSYSVDALPPVAVAAIRFAMATAFMWLWCRAAGVPLQMRPDQWLPACVAGVLMFVQIASFNWGVMRSNSSHATMLINTAVFWVAGFEHFLGTDRMTPRKLFGLAIAAAGVASVLLSTDFSGSATSIDTVTVAGDLVLVASAVILAVKLVYIRHVLPVIDPAKLMYWHNVVGLVCFTTYSALFEAPSLGRLTWPAAWGVVYQGVFVAGMCFYIQAVLLRHHTASQISVFGFATPLFGVLLGVLLRGDPLSSNIVLAAICVAAGILLVNGIPRATR
jgi:drug/metabolite transporter (DMT)-like permease